MAASTEAGSEYLDTLVDQVKTAPSAKKAVCILADMLVAQDRKQDRMYGEIREIKKAINGNGKPEISILGRLTSIERRFSIGVKAILGVGALISSVLGILRFLGLI